MIEANIPACWTWPVAAEDLERAFTASRRDLALGLIKNWQDGRCAVCGTRMARLENDHDHDTGSLRGLLCGSCNKREPHAPEDSPVFARYRFRPPVLILGVRIHWAAPDSARVVAASAEALQRHQEARDPGRRR